MARQWWRGATLLWVTHDIAETESFGRVLVIDGGRIVEDGDPAELGRRAGLALRRAGPRRSRHAHHGVVGSQVAPRVARRRQACARTGTERR